MIFWFNGRNVRESTTDLGVDIIQSYIVCVSLSSDVRQHNNKHQNNQWNSIPLIEAHIH